MPAVQLVDGPRPQQALRRRATEVLTERRLQHLAIHPTQRASLRCLDPGHQGEGPLVFLRITDRDGQAFVVEVVVQALFPALELRGDHRLHRFLGIFDGARVDLLHNRFRERLSFREKQRDLGVRVSHDHALARLLGLAQLSQATAQQGVRIGSVTEVVVELAREA